MKIREASHKDVDGIAKVHLHSWRSTYRGIVSDRYLFSLTLKKRKKGWIKTFNKPNHDERIFLAEDEGEIVGFCYGGRNRIDNSDYDSELYAIYIFRRISRKGTGKKLIKKLIKTLQEKNYRSMMVWVLEFNPAINFYRKLGREEIIRKNVIIGEDTLTEVALGWKNIKNITF